jgi:hypothetical protein
MDTHASIHVQEEESSTLSVGNAFAPLVTGMVPLVSFAPILKSGRLQDWHAFALTVIGMVKLALSVQPIKYGSQLQ